MKLKHIFWGFSAAVAVVAMIAGFIVVFDRFIARKECPDGYIDCGEEEIIVED